MKKPKYKIGLFCLLLPIGLTIGFFFSGLIDMVLSGETPDIQQLRPEIIYNNILENERHRKLTLCIEIVVTLGVAAILLMKRKDTFESDTTQLTEQIYYLSDDVHSLTIGTTRSGKSRCIVLQSIAFTALSGESMIISDPKGELAAYCSPYLEKFDYEVIRLDFKDPLKSSRYNFLQPIIDAVNDGDNSKAVTLVWDIVSSLVEKSRHSEAIWTNGEMEVIAGAIMAVIFDNMANPQFQNLTNIYYFILYMCQTMSDALLLNLRRMNLNRKTYAPTSPAST